MTQSNTTLDHRFFFPALALLSSAFSGWPALAEPIPANFRAAATDRAAIETLLATYTHAVSTKDQALFETLLLNKDVPFSYVAADGIKAGKEKSTSNYESFQKGVFEGKAFTQRFQNVIVQNDGGLATVSLVFINTDTEGSNWGWKTMQLLKIGGRWKIASEFFTNHS